jgi:nucleotide-binding universal stress UspA family protein
VAKLPYRKILVPVDGSRTSLKGLKEAIRLAKAGGSRVVLLHVVDEFIAFSGMEVAGNLVQEMIEGLVAGGRRTLEKARRDAERLGVRAQTILRERVGGSAAYEIVRQAKKNRCDLIVLGTHGRRGVRRLALGSDAELVVRNATVPVLLVRAAGKRP